MANTKKKRKNDDLINDESSPVPAQETVQDLAKNAATTFADLLSSPSQATIDPSALNPQPLEKNIASADLELEAPAGSSLAEADQSEVVTSAGALTWQMEQMGFVESEAQGESKLDSRPELSAELSGDSTDELSEEFDQDSQLEATGDAEIETAENEGEVKNETASISALLEEDAGTASIGLSAEDAILADEVLGPAEFFEADRVKSILESLLFVSDRPISMATIKQIFAGSNVRSKDITRALEILASDLAHSGRGVVLEEITAGFQLRTKIDNAEYLRRLNKTRPFRLSGPALEALSIIAYKQPITKHEVDEIRGVESGHLIRALMDRVMVSFAGKAENLPGKPMQYGTTKRFLETFGLRNLRELPTLAEIDDLLPEGIGDEVEENKPILADLTDGMSETIGGTYSEGEEELAKITDQISTIDTSSEFFEQEKIRQREKRDQERAANIREALAVGEAVEDKDVKWLKRYDNKLALAAQGLLLDPASADVTAMSAEMEEERQGAAETLAVESDDQSGMEVREPVTNSDNANSASPSNLDSNSEKGAEFRRDIEGLSQKYGASDDQEADDGDIDADRNEDEFLNASDWDELNEEVGKGDAARDDDPPEY